MPVFNNALAGAAGQSGGDDSYKIERSLRFSEDDDSYLTRTPTTAGNRKTWTLSFWMKRGKFGTTNRHIFETVGSPEHTGLYTVSNSDALEFRGYTSGFNWRLTTEAVLRDPSAWYHIVVNFNSTAGTASDRAAIYINGVKAPLATASYPSPNVQTNWNNSVQHFLGSFHATASHWDGYLAEVHFVDGQALAPDGVFGEFDTTTGVWNPIEYTHADTVDYSNNNQITIDPGNYYLNNQDGPKAFNGDGNTYIDSRLGTGSNSTTNIIWQPTGGIQNVTKIRVHTNYATHYRINDGSWTSFSSSGTYAQIYSGTAFTLTKLEIRRNNCQASDWGHRVTFYEINDVEYQNVGTNSFHLPFSSNTTLTHPNKYKTQGSGSTPPSNAASLYYNTGHYFGSNQGVTYDAGSVRKFWVQPGSSDPVVKTSNNGTDWTTVFNGSQTWNDPIEVTCRYVYMSSSGNGFGPYLKQPAFAADTSGNDNHWLDQNLNPSVTPATTSHQYWRAVIYGLNQSHWPRMSKLYMYEADGTRREHKSFTSDNCSDQGSIPSEGGVYTTDFGSSSYNFTNVGIYSTYNGGTRTGYADVYYSDDGNTWTYSFTSVVTNANQCGERVGTLSESDNLLDSPTNYEDGTNIGGNYAVMNPLSARSQVSVSNGNLDCTVTSNSHSWTGRKVFSTIGVNSGKWYAEMTVNSEGSVYAAICGNTENINESNSIGWQSQGWGYYKGGIIVIQTTENSSGIPAYGAGDTIGVALDVDNLKVKFYKNGTQVGTTAGYDITADLTWFFAFDSYDESDVSWNFGQRPFKISSVPTGHKALCTENFDTPLIEDPSTAFDVALWTGNGSSAQTISTPKLSPDMVWYKERSSTSSHGIVDAVRSATNAAKILYSDRTDSEATGNAVQSITSLNNNGFTIGSSDNSINQSSQTYVGWAWEGGDLATGTYSSYDQSQHWSANTSGAVFGGVIGSLFDTATSTGIYPGTTGSAGTFDLTLTFSPGIACTSLRVYTKDKQANATGSVSVNGGTHQSVSGNDSWTTLTAPSTLNSLVLRRVASSASNNAFRFTAIEVNGKILIDPGVIPVGGLNSSFYNQDQVWSNFLSRNTVSGGSNLGSATDAFSGTIWSMSDAANCGYSNDYTGSSITFAPTSGTLVGQVVKLYQRIRPSTVTVNGTAATITTSGNTRICTVDLGSPQNITSVVTTATTIGETNAFSYIEVDGKLLIDSGVSLSGLTQYPSIASTVRANPTAGFSIVTATQGSGNSTWGHGLNAKPDLIVMKARDQAFGWFVSHSALDNQSTKFLRLHSPNGVATNANWFASTEPTSSVITTKAGGMWSQGDDFVAYCWTAVEGYSAFTSHTVGSGTNFAYLGFRPRFLMLKRTGQGTTTNMSYASWAMFDTARDTYNEVDFDTILYANRNYAEGKRGDSAGSTAGSYLNIDILSNGIRFQSGGAEFSQPSDKIIVMAWAEHPFKYARAR